MGRIDAPPCGSFLNCRDHYARLYRLYESVWGPYFHYGIYRTPQDTAQSAQENTINIMLAELNISKGSKLLDIGCGNGRTSSYILNNYKARVTGIDFVPQLVAHAGSTAITQKEGTLDFLVGAAENMPFESCSFDCAISNEVLCHVSDKKKVFSEVARVLRPGGMFVFSDLYEISHSGRLNEFHKKLSHVQPMALLGELIRAISEGSLRLIKTMDYSSQLRLNYLKTNESLLANREKILVEYGSDLLEYVASVISTGSDRSLISELGWGIFVCSLRT